MTFERLHEGIKKDCNCVPFGTSPVPTHAFYRRGANEIATTDDFRSFFELGRPLSGRGCKDYCHHRGVSVFRIIKDLETRKLELRAIYQIRPTPDEKFAYFVRIKTEAGLVWYQENTEHCELLKTDDFRIDFIEFIDVFDMSEPI